LATVTKKIKILLKFLLAENELNLEILLKRPIKNRSFFQTTDDVLVLSVERPNFRPSGNNRQFQRLVYLLVWFGIRSSKIKGHKINFLPKFINLINKSYHYFCLCIVTGQNQKITTGREISDRLFQKKGARQKICIFFSLFQKF
jgi:hypothetical protein